MSLDSVATYLINTSNPLHLRAVRLFEFQVSIFYPKSFASMLKSTADGARARTRRLRSARIFAAIKFLEDLESQLHKDRATVNIPLQQLAKNRNYCKLYNEIIAPNGGWMRIRYSKSAKAFVKNLEKQRNEAHEAANIVDVAYRIANTRNLTPRRGILHAAQCIVQSDEVYRPHFLGGERKDSISRPEIKNRWRRFRSASIFLFLLLRYKNDFDFLPAAITKKSFSGILLRQANNTRGLKLFFAAYQELREKIGLETKIFKFEKLESELGVNAPSLPFEPISPELFEKGFKMATEERKRTGRGMRRPRGDRIPSTLKGREQMPFYKNNDNS
jgi:hypothetical protein